MKAVILSILSGSLLVATPWVDADLPKAIKLPAPPKSAIAAKVSAAPVLVELRMIDSAANQITDDDAWLKKHNLTIPETFLRVPAGIKRGRQPAAAPAEYQGFSCIKAFTGASGTGQFLIYGKNYYSAPYLLKIDATTKGVEAVFDASAYGNVAWAGMKGEVLYLAHSPGNFSAKDGKGAYLTAIDTAARKVLWRTAEKTCHGQFLIIDDSIIAGYGFTGEPDFLFVIDRLTGKTTKKITVKSKADWILKKGNILYVRCYNTDYRFTVID